jgi:hypothetical protein
VTDREIQRARLLALVLPAAEREEIERHYGVRPAALSAVLGVLELWLGLAVYGLGFQGIGGGIIAWLIWHANPVTWLGLLIMWTGILRGVNYLSNRDSLGEPLVWLFLRLSQARRAASERRRIAAEFGEERPDRVVVDPDGSLLLLASRSKPDWDEYRTVRLEDRFFQIAAVEERPDGRFTAVAYRLEEVPESEPLRGIVHSPARLPPL